MGLDSSASTLPTPAVPESANPSDSTMDKFPPFNPDGFDAHQQMHSPYIYPYTPPASSSISSATSPVPQTIRRGSGSRLASDLGLAYSPQLQSRPNRQKSLSEALQSLRTRRSSVTQHAQELAEALKPPVSPKLVLLCIFWYFTSIASNTSSKTILNVFPRPITLTLVQFAFVCGWCILLGALAQIYPSIGRHIPTVKNGVRAPSRNLVVATLPLTAFQIGGHILSSDATSRLPVSLVHTIKGLSPLFTVLFYRMFFSVHYNLYTYLSLIPLTVGVFMACSARFDSAGDILGLLSAFSSTILFVTQNIVSKKLFNEAAAAEASSTVIPPKLRKPDKLNLLCYSTGIAFIFTFPLWIWSEGYQLLAHFFSNAAIPLSGGAESIRFRELATEFVFNGTCQFLQSLVAFTLLSMVSPVTYSVGSLIKRVFVICFAIVWFRNSFTNTQAFGIFLTFVGLYLYDRTSDSHKAASSRRSRMTQLKDFGEQMLPLHEKPSGISDTVSSHTNSYLTLHNRVSRDPSPIHLPPASISSCSQNGYMKPSPNFTLSLGSAVASSAQVDGKRSSDFWDRSGASETPTHTSA